GGLRAHASACDVWACDVQANEVATDANTPSRFPGASAQGSRATMGGVIVLRAQTRGGRRRILSWVVWYCCGPLRSLLPDRRRVMARRRISPVYAARVAAAAKMSDYPAPTARSRNRSVVHTTKRQR